MPGIFVVRCHEEVRPGWEFEQVGNLWAALDQVLLVPGLEEVFGIGKISGPHVPAARPTARGMPESVHRPLPPSADERLRGAEDFTTV